MTSFEIQIADVLNAIFAAGDTTLAPGDVLAPRVAAAILAAASAGYWSGGEGYPPSGVTEKALAALRGQS